MGGNVSSQTIESVSRTTNEVLNNVLTSMVNSSSSSSYSNQSIYINVDGAKCDTINARLISSNKLSALSQMSSQDLTNLSNTLLNKVTADIEQAAKQANTGLNLGQVNVGVLNTRVDDYLKNNITNNIKTSIANSFVSTTSSDQNIYISAKNLTCKVLDASADQVIQLISTNIAKNIVENTIDNVAKNEDVQKLKQTIDQKNAGISLGFGLILLAIVAVFIFFGKTIMKYIIPILMIAVGYGIYYFYSVKQTITMAIFICIEIILLMLELYCIFSKPALPTLPNLPTLPKIAISSDVEGNIQGTISLKNKQI